MTGELLSNSVALVTGGGRGIGKELCAGLAAAGARVAAADIGPITGVELGVVMDVTDYRSVSAGVARVLETFGHIDLLVNNAALYGGMTRAPFEELPEEEWDRMMAINVKGIWNVTRAVVPSMRERGYGKIVNIASTVIFFGQANMLHYVASKGAVLAMTRSLARELGPSEIRVNAIAPGFTLSEASRESLKRPGREQALEHSRAQTALQRLQEPADLVGTVQFLLSPLSDSITGQTVNVDGGFIYR